VARAAVTTKGGGTIHGEWHVDALIIMMMLAALMTMLLKFTVRRVAKWLRHVIWMKRRAHGTLITDSEALYWGKLIDRPDYKPVWRWFYAEEWRKKHGADAQSVVGEKKKRSLARKIGFVNAGLVISIVAILLIGAAGGGGWTPVQFPTQSEIKVEYVENATLTQTVAGHFYYTAEWVPVPAITIAITLKRTDNAFSDRDVQFSVKSGNHSVDIDGVPQTTVFVKSAFYDFGGQSVVVSNPTGDEFGLSFPMRRNQSIMFLLVISLVDYANTDSEELFSITSTGGPTSMHVFTPNYIPEPLPF